MLVAIEISGFDIAHYLMTCKGESYPTEQKFNGAIQMLVYGQLPTHIIPNQNTSVKWVDDIFSLFYQLFNRRSKEAITQAKEYPDSDNFSDGSNCYKWDTEDPIHTELLDWMMTQTTKYAFLID